MAAPRVKIWGVVPAAGAGRRMGTGDRKQFLRLGGEALLVRTLRVLESWEPFAGLVVVAPPEQVEWTRGLLAGAGLEKILGVVAGGAERQDSVARGVAALAEAAADDLVLVHDGVRPLVPVDRLDDLAAAARPDGALLAIPCRDTLKREAAGCAVATLERAGLWQAQTPQAFPLALLRAALEHAREQGLAATDEASLVEALGRRPRLVPGAPDNIKVTHPEDLELARRLLGATAAPDGQLRVGHGYDVHRLAAGRRLVLGGVEIAHELGLLGHSDADVLTHAVADACLGAAGLGDIGRHFPDSDPRWEGADSIALLAAVGRLVQEAGGAVRAVDATLVAQRPRIAPHIGAMEARLAEALELPAGGVTVKATTTEQLGFPGREEGMAAYAVALVGGLVRM